MMLVHNCQQPATWFQSAGFWTVTGVITGFLLAEGSRYLRHRYQIFLNKKTIKSELESLLKQIDQKIDIVEQVIASLRNKGILPGASVRGINTGYNKLLSGLYPYLDQLRRNCLHVIYERMRVGDEILETFESKILEEIKEKVVADPFAAYIDKFESIKATYADNKILINSYLKGKPIDVFNVQTR